MNKQDLFKKLIPKERDLQQIAKMAVRSPEIVNYLISGIKEDNVRIRFGSNNTLLIISEKTPELIYPHFDIFKEYLRSENRIIKWTAILIVANLTVTDNKNKFDNIFNLYFSEITGPVMITAANIVKGAAIIAKAKPYLIKDIINEMFKIINGSYQTDECFHIVIGHTISSFDKFFTLIDNKKEILDFVRLYINNPRRPTRNKAEKFIRKWNKIAIQV